MLGKILQSIIVTQLFSIVLYVLNAQIIVNNA
jgi:hypothetical protein